MCQPSATFRVSSNAMRPLWTIFAFEKQTEQQLHFALRLMTEDWRSLRASNVYSVREMMQVEAAVMQGFVHKDPSEGLCGQVQVLSPVTPSSSSTTGAQSYFTPRSQEDKLHFQLKAFKFIQDDRSEFYITCHLKATTVRVPIDSTLSLLLPD